MLVDTVKLNLSNCFPEQSKVALIAGMGAGTVDNPRFFFSSNSTENAAGRYLGGDAPIDDCAVDSRFWQASAPRARSEKHWPSMTLKGRAAESCASRATIPAVRPQTSNYVLNIFRSTPKFPSY
jgi:hypothetical protein